MDSGTRLEAGELLACVERARPLARCLVRDPNLADDILQDVYLLALERPPRRARAGSELWAWMRRVVTTMARQHYRGEGRRRARERRASREESRPSFVEGLLIEEQAGIVRATLAELPEPYRSTLRLRLFEGLEPREIARLQGVTAAAVRMRLTRGIRQARAMLHGRDARRRNGARAALLGLRLRWPSGVGSVAAAGGLFVLLIPQLQSGGAARAVGLPPLRPDVGSDLGPAATLARPGPPRAARTRPASVGVRASRGQAPHDSGDSGEFGGPPLHPITGRALWTDGSPARGVALSLSERPEPSIPASPHARTDRDGNFTLLAALPAEGVRWVTASSPAEVAVLAAAVERDGLLGSPTVVVAETAPVAGIVLDRAGVPVSGARLRWRAPADLSCELGVSTVFTSALETCLETDAEGRFTGDLPIVRGALLEVFVPGEAPFSLGPLPNGSAELLVRTPDGERRCVSGRVVDRKGVPVESALVGIGAATCRTGPDGSFELAGPRSAGPGTSSLYVSAPGFAPRVASLAGGASELELVLGPAGSIHGRVVDGEGRPLAGIQVVAADLEAVPDGPAGPDGPHESGGPGERGRSLEGLARRVPRRTPRPSTTDARGEFVLDGLQERAYRVLAVAPDSLLASERLLQPGSFGELVLDCARLLPTLDGSVVDEHGEPVAGASIWVLRETARILSSGRALHADQLARPVVRSRADGSFRLADVPPDASIQVEASGRFPVRCAPDAFVEARMSSRCDVSLVAPDGVARIGFLDAAGDPQPTLTFDPDTLATSHTSRTVDLRSGRSPVLTVPERAVWLRLLDADDRELATLPLSPRPGTHQRLSLN